MDRKKRRAAAQKRLQDKRVAHGMCRCGRTTPKPGGKRCQLCLDDRRDHDQQLKRECIDAYGGKCVCCGEVELDFLTIDHGNNDGAEHRRRLSERGGKTLYADLRRAGYPQNLNLRSMCWNCQWGRRISGVCPHQAQKALGASL